MRFEAANMKRSRESGKPQTTQQCSRAAIRLHRYLVAKHWDGRALTGPDPGIRFNYRVGRFIKSYLNRVDWNDDYYYLQAQGYWILSNWLLFDCLQDETCRDIAISCSLQMLTQQRADGAWLYPNREWKGRVATAEGTWGSIGLLESFGRTGDDRFLAGALCWHRFLHDVIGFRRSGDELAVNYFARRGGLSVPNNSALVLRYLAALADLTGDKSYLEPCSGLLHFMRRVQTPTGELPYAIGTTGRDDRPHFQCYQYNAFQSLDLMAYRQISGDWSALDVISGMLAFLRTGLAADGRARYECGNEYREVTYHTAVLAAAFAQAHDLGIDDYEGLAQTAYKHLIGSQRADGGFVYSRGDYRILHDRRSYPRYLAMILYHLLLNGAPALNAVSTGEAGAAPQDS